MLKDFAFINKLYFLKQLLVFTKMHAAVVFKQLRK